MFSKNQENIPNNLSKTTFFNLLDAFGINQEDKVSLDENLEAHGYNVIFTIKSVTVIGEVAFTGLLETNQGLGTLQFSKNERLKAIDVTYIPTNVVGGAIKNIMRIDISERESHPEEPPETEA